MLIIGKNGREGTYTLGVILSTSLGIVLKRKPISKKTEQIVTSLALQIIEQQILGTVIFWDLTLTLFVELFDLKSLRAVMAIQCEKTLEQWLKPCGSSVLV